MIVQMDTLFHGLLNSLPVRLFKALLRPGRDFQKPAVLGVKPLQNSLRD